MVNSKKRVRKHTRYFIELSPQRNLLILKRGRLMRTGPAIAIEKLPIAPAQNGSAWLQANLEDGSSPKAHPWDLAHALATKIKKELGELPYIEPEISNGQVGIFRDLYEMQSNKKNKNRNKSPVQDADFLRSMDPKSLIPDPMRDLSAMMPSLGTGLDDGNHSSKIDLPQANSLLRPTDNEEEEHEIAKSSPEAVLKRARRRYVFPLIYEFADWKALPAKFQKMLEVELVQVYRVAKLRARYPFLESDQVPKISQVERVQIIDELITLPMSKALHQFLKQHIENQIANDQSQLTCQ